MSHNLALLSAQLEMTGKGGKRGGGGGGVPRRAGLHAHNYHFPTNGDKGEGR